MLLKKLVSYAKLTPISDFKVESTFIGIASSSKLVKNGDVFFAIEGLNDDGNKYVTEAVKNGACAVVTHKKHGCGLQNIGVPVFEASDVRIIISSIG